MSGPARKISLTPDDFMEQQPTGGKKDLTPDDFMGQQNTNAQSGKLQPRGVGPSEAAARAVLTQDQSGKFDLQGDNPANFDVVYRHLGEGLLKGAGNTVEGVGRLINKIPVVGEVLSPRSGLDALHLATRPTSPAQKLGYYGEQGAEFMIPGGAEEAALAHLPAAVKAARFIRPISRAALQAVDAGTINKLHGDSFKEGAGASLIGTGIAEGARKIAPAVAESALGITRNMRGFGKTPGLAALEETSGIRPISVARSAGKKISSLNQELETRIGNASALGPAPVSAQPAIDVVDNAIATAGKRNSPLRAQYKGIRTQLTNDLETGASLGVQTTPMDLLERKRGIGDLETTWTPEQKKGARGIIPKVYGAMDKELDAVAPGSAEINQRISSLIPVRQRGELEDLNAGLGQRTLHRIAAHTGALTGAVFGAREGYERGGLPGALAGGITGVVIPELITSPTGEMAAARSLYRFPRRLPAGLSLQAMRALRDDNLDEDQH